MNNRERLRRLWGHRDFRLLFLSQGVSALGDWMATIALMVLVLELTGSSTAVGGILVLRLAPAIVAGPVASRVVPRRSQRGVMLSMDAARVGIVLAIPLIGELWWVYLWAFVLELCGLLFLPARDSAIPALVEDEESLAMANSLILGSSYGMIPVGAAMFAVVAAGGAALTGHLTRPSSIALWCDAATFGASFLLLRQMSSRALDNVPQESDEQGELSFVAALRLPFVRKIAPLTITVALGLGGLFSLGIVFVRDVLGASDAEFALLIASFGVGAGIGMVLVSRLHEIDLRSVQLLVCTQGLVVATMSLAPAIGFALVGAVLFGAATAAAVAAAMSVLQHELESRERELAFTAFHVFIRTGLATSALAAGAAADLVANVDWPVVGTLPGSRVVLCLCGLVVMLVPLVGLVSTRRQMSVVKDATPQDPTITTPTVESG